MERFDATMCQCGIGLLCIASAAAATLAALFYVILV